MPWVGNQSCSLPLLQRKEESGNGLGLWASRAIVEKHEGSIRLTSTESGYLDTTVSIFLPLKPKSRCTPSCRVLSEAAH